MAHRNNIKGAPFIVLDDDGFMQLYTNCGQLVTHNEWVRLHDSTDEVSTAICKFLVNIVGSKEEMMANIVNE
jgi:hypothetical protein